MSSMEEDSSIDGPNKKTSAKKVDYRRLIHNGIERKRKIRINELIDKIVDLLPFKYEFDHTVSRTARLEKVHSYIVNLKNRNEALMYSNPTGTYGELSSLMTFS